MTLLDVVEKVPEPMSGAAEKEVDVTTPPASAVSLM
jgi:hypothetical protein